MQDDTPTVVLICHEQDRLDTEGLASWLASTMRLAGLIIIRDPRNRIWRAARREIRRVGWLRFVDVIAFRVFARFRLARRDAAWKESELERLRQRFPARLESVPRIVVSSPNSDESRTFIERLRPDIAIARCKVILKRAIFEIPRVGTFVLHPGICPEYRNAHGCFWALARRDMDRVGATLLRIDSCVDTGPVYDYYKADIDEQDESHIVIQHRVVFDNLDRLAEDLQQIEAGTAETIDTSGRESAAWGQPRLTDSLRWKRAARKAAAA